VAAGPGRGFKEEWDVRGRDNRAGKAGGEQEDRVKKGLARMGQVFE
jgi:hypothetical protein